MIDSYPVQPDFDNSNERQAPTIDLEMRYASGNNDKNIFVEVAMRRADDHSTQPDRTPLWPDFSEERAQDSQW